ncbi:MAG: CHAT domain-containing protein [Bacteroidota bacterium]
MTYKDAIKKDLTDGRMKPALEKLDELVKASGDDFYSGTVIQLFAQFNRSKRDRDDGISSQQDFEMQNNRIRRSIMSLLSSLDDADYQAEDSTRGSLPADGSQAGTKNGTLQADDTASDSIRILMLTSNPSDTAKLMLDKEYSRIHDELQKSSNYGDYELMRQRETTIKHLNEQLLVKKPEIVHFSGHGQAAKAGDIVDESDPLSEAQPSQKAGLMFKQIEGHETQVVTGDQLQLLFGEMIEDEEIPIQLVMLNACYSQNQAESIAQVVDYVIGTNDEVSDEAAWTFSSGFYFRLVKNEGTELDDSIVKKAFKSGRRMATMQGEALGRFKLYVKGELIY